MSWHIFRCEWMEGRGRRPRHVLPLLLALLSLLSSLAAGQLRIQSPKRLFDKLVEMEAISKETFFTLIGSTASFGTPTYGTTLRRVCMRFNCCCCCYHLLRGFLLRETDLQLLGRAFYYPDPPRKLDSGEDAGSHCDASYCVNLEAAIKDWKASQQQGGLGNVVLFVDRGICTFAAKVEVAQSCGADAVVVVDHGSQKWTREMIRHNIIMSDDGRPRDIRTPSILIAKEDGAVIKQEIVAGGGEPVLVELEWKMPSQWPVGVKLWADPGDMQAAAFVENLAPYMLRLGPHVRFQTIYNVFSLSGGSEELCLSDGFYAKYPRLYCAFEPNAQVLGLTGSEVVQESLLQSCLYATTKTAVGTLPDSEYSREWWLYQQRRGDPKDGCSFSGQGRNAWGPACSKRLLSEVLSAGQLRAVELCMSDESGRQLLDYSKNNRGWSVVAMTINGARYSGQLTVEPVLRAICSATTDPLSGKYRAEECSDILVDTHTASAPWLKASLDWRSFFFVTFLVIVICLGLSLIYYRYAKQQFVEGMQRRVQHEVQQQLQLYHRMDELKGGAAERSPLV
ncbi:hypothetical protein Efla_002302 [Eimeria flavescens]